jgi:hypothetical protein
MGRADAPISIRLISETQRSDVDAFASRHSMTRNAAILALISFGLQHERQVMSHVVKQYELSRGERQ